MKCFYQGAGVLFSYRSLWTGKRYIFLGKRSIKPYRGYWTVPGGKKNRYESFWQCAIRETVEEVWFTRKADLKNASVRDRAVKLTIPFFFEYRIYLVDLPARFKRLPKIRAEFSNLRWWDVNKLPGMLHPGLAPAIKQFTDMLLKEKIK